jgi:hypothetical protein
MNNKLEGLSEILTVRDIKEHLGCGINRAYKIMSMDGFPAMTVGKRKYVLRSKYEQWLNENAKHRIII